MMTFFFSLVKITICTKPYTHLCSLFYAILFILFLLSDNALSKQALSR